MVDVNCCVKVSNISRMVKNENLKELFTCCGEIRNMNYVMMGTEQLCIVEFYDASCTEMAKLLDGTEVGDKKLVVGTLSAAEHDQLFNPKKSTQKKEDMSEYEKACRNLEHMMRGPNGEEEANDEVKRTIYLGNISNSCTSADIRNAFSKVGNILYIKFSNQSKRQKNTAMIQAGKHDFRYCFVEFETEEAARMSFTLHGHVIAGQPVKIGKAHNPIFKDDPNDKDNPLWAALQAAKRVEKRVLPPTEPRERERRDGGERKDRKRRRRRRRRRDRDRSRSYDRDEPEEEPKMFFDGYQWHFNDKVQDVETHVTSVIRDVGGQTTEKDVLNLMEDAAAASLKKLQLMKTGMGIGFNVK